MSHSKKNSRIDVINFERFSLYRKNLIFVIFVNRKCLKAISSVKIKIFKRLFLNIYAGMGYFILTTYWNNLIHKVWGNPDTDLEGARGAHTHPFFWQSLVVVFCDHFEELQTVFIQVKLIINKVSHFDIRLLKYYQNIFSTQSFIGWQTVIMLFLHSINCS